MPDCRAAQSCTWLARGERSLVGSWRSRTIGARTSSLRPSCLAYGDPEGMRTYWRWCVTEAFPTAYAAAG